MNRKTVLAFVSLALLLNSCGNKNRVVKEDERVEPVRTQVMEKTQIARSVEFSTTLQGYETVNIAPSLTGKIEQIYVDVSSSVSAGQLLVRMDQTQLNSTKLVFSNLSLEMNRMETLKKSGSISQQSYDQLKLQYDQTQESLAFLQANTFVKAPFAGIIASKNYENGELFAGAMPILVLTQVNQLKALINIPETYFPLVKQGMKLPLISDIYPDQEFAAAIEIVYPTIDPATHTFQVQLKIPNPKGLLRPGMFARATLDMDRVETIVVPYQAVLKQQGSNDRYVFINDNGVAKRIAVTLGGRYDDQTEIISSEIKGGDELIVAGQARLVNGVKLNVIPEGQEMAE